MRMLLWGQARTLQLLWDPVGSHGLHPTALALGSSEQTDPPRNPVEAATGSVIKPSGKGCHGTKSKEKEAAPLLLLLSLGAFPAPLPGGVGYSGVQRTPRSPCLSLGSAPCLPGADTSGWGSWVVTCLVPWGFEVGPCGVHPPSHIPHAPTAPYARGPCPHPCRVPGLHLPWCRWLLGGFL